MVYPVYTNFVAPAIDAGNLNDVNNVVYNMLGTGGVPPLSTLEIRNNLGVTAAIAATDAGRLLRTTAYYRVAGVQNISVDGAAPTTTGAGTFTALAATSFVLVEATGAGGGSGGNPSTSAVQQAFSAGGGGGSYGIGRFTSPLAGVAVTIGAAGLGGTAGAAGSAGGSTIFGSLLTAPGGAGSAAGTANGGVGVGTSAAGGSAPTGANVLAMAGGTSFSPLSAALGFLTSQQGGASGSGVTGSYGTGAVGKYNGISTASPQPGTDATNGGLLIIYEYS